MGLFGSRGYESRPYYDDSDLYGDTDPELQNKEHLIGKYDYDDVERILMREKFRARFTNGDAFVFINDLRMIYSEDDLHEIVKYNTKTIDRYRGLFSDTDIDVIKAYLKTQFSTVAAADKFLSAHREAIEIAWLEGVGSHAKEVQVLIDEINKYSALIEHASVQSIKVLRNGPTQPKAAEIRAIMTAWKDDMNRTIRRLEELKEGN